SCSRGSRSAGEAERAGASFGLVVPCASCARRWRGVSPTRSRRTRESSPPGSSGRSPRSAPARCPTWTWPCSPIASSASTTGLARRDLAELRRAAALPREAVLGELRDQWAAAYGLQVTAQSLLDAGAHVLTATFSEAPRDYGEIVPALVRHEVLPPELGKRLL